MPSIRVVHLKIAPEVRIPLVRVPAGEFVMGSDAQDEETYDDERPSHRVNLPEYLIGRFPITVNEFDVFVRRIRYDLPFNLDSQVGNHPVRHVNWFDAVAYCKWVTIVTGRQVRLPTEAEWEKAARGVDGRLWPWGNDPPTPELGNFKMFRTTITRRYPTPGPDQSVRGTSRNDTTSVGRFSPQGDSPYGCADMSGNVWEWTHSLFRPYPYKGEDGRELEDDLGMRVVRGGSFLGHLKRSRCTSRLRQPPSNRVAPDLGFRICLPGGQDK